GLAGGAGRRSARRARPAHSPQAERLPECDLNKSGRLSRRPRSARATRRNPAGRRSGSGWRSCDGRLGYNHRQLRVRRRPAMSAPKPLENYRSYKGLPQLAGLCTVEEAARPGLSVEECVRRLKRFHYAFKRLHQILTARITSEPIYELKTGFAHHAYLCAEHVQALRTRIAEMREPPLGLEDVPHPALEAFFDEILAAPTTEELLAGVYGEAIESLEQAVVKYLNDTNPLTDAPSRRVLGFARIELLEMSDWGEQCIRCLVTDERKRQVNECTMLLRGLLSAAGRLDGTALPSPPAAAGGLAPEQLPRRYSKTPYKYDPVPK